jgi:hypothetical protein
MSFLPMSLWLQFGDCNERSCHKTVKEMQCFDAFSVCACCDGMTDLFPDHKIQRRFSTFATGPRRCKFVPVSIRLRETILLAFFPITNRTGSPTHRVNVPLTFSPLFINLHPQARSRRFHFLRFFVTSPTCRNQGKTSRYRQATHIEGSTPSSFPSSTESASHSSAGNWSVDRADEA